MLAEVKKCAESKDIKGLHYIFVDCLDVDPTFEKYEADYEYCKGIDGFLEPHKEITPFLGSEGWNKQYWEQLKMDLMKNFSEKRFSYMRMVAKSIYSDKIVRLNEERNRERKKMQTKIQNIPEEHDKVQKKTIVNSSSVSKSEEQDRMLAEKTRELELQNQQDEKKREKERRDRSKAARQADATRQAEDAKRYQQSVESSKKVLGVAIGIVAIIVVIVLLKVL